MADNNPFDRNIQQGSSPLSGGQYSSGFGQDAFALRQSMQTQVNQPQQSVYQPQPVYQQQTYTQPEYQNPSYSQVPPMPEYNFAMESDVSVGEWLLSTVLVLMPVVGFILALVWAFSSETAKAKQNWAKAMLIIKVVGIIFAALSVATIGVAFVRALQGLSGGNFY